MRKHALIFALAALLLALACPAQAQWTNDPYRGMVSVCNDTGYQDFAQTCQLGEGNTLFAWDDMRTGIDQVYYQVLNSAGLPLQEINGLPLFEGNWIYGWGSTTMKNLFPDGEGGAVIAVVDLRAGLDDIYGQRVDAQGNRLWGATGMPLVLWPGSEAVVIKATCADSFGNVFVSWMPNTNDTTQLYIQKFDSSGQLLWGPLGALVMPMIIIGSWGNCAELVPDGQGGVMVIFQDYRSSPIYGQTFFQHLDGDGTLLLRPRGVPVLTGSGLQFQMGFGACGPDGQGGAIWLTTAGGSASMLRLIRTNGAGHTLWDVSSPYICWHGIGDIQRHPIYNTVWITSSEDRVIPQVFRSYLYSVDIHGRFLFGRGGIPNVGRNLTPTADGMIAVETDFYAPTTHVVAKRIHTSGRILWQSPVALGGLTGGGAVILYSASCSPDGADGAVVALGDRREFWADNYNFSAQRIRSNGSLGNPIVRVLYNPGAQIQSVLDNLVSYTLPQAGEIKLDLFDLLGRKIATLQEGFKQPGSYMVPIDQQHLPSGVYLVRLNTPVGSDAARIIIAK